MDRFDEKLVSLIVNVLLFFVHSIKLSFLIIMKHVHESPSAPSRRVIFKGLLYSAALFSEV